MSIEVGSSLSPAILYCWSSIFERKQWEWDSKVPPQWFWPVSLGGVLIFLDGPHEAHLAFSNHRVATLRPTSHCTSCYKSGITGEYALKDQSELIVNSSLLLLSEKALPRA